MKAFLERAARTFSLPSGADEEMPRENVAPGRGELGDASRSALDLVAGLTAIDRSIYEVVRARETVAGPARPGR